MTWGWSLSPHTSARWDDPDDPEKSRLRGTSILKATDSRIWKEIKPMEVAKKWHKL